MRVLKVCRPIHRRDFASQLLPDAKVLRAPSHALPEFDQAGSNASRGNGGFSPMYISGEVHFDAARQIEAALDGRADDSDLFERNHFTAQLPVRSRPVAGRLCAPAASEAARTLESGR